MKQRRATRPVALLVTLLVLGSVAWATVAQKQTADRATRVLVFSGTGWYRHPEIPRTNGWLVRVLGEAGYAADVKDTAQDITPERLVDYQVLVLNNTTAQPDLLDEKQRQGIADWYKGGRGIVALHAALVHQTKWKWFYELAGCDFNS